ncbi:hypothetical protein HDU86_006967 [Geranomyces michiganensis]|nr:hypothetical protein HDU86_006967 [Geranomyces michiganensis]
MKFQYGLSIACGFALGHVGQVAAWGGEGHKVVGSVAASLVKPATLSRIQEILSSGQTLGSVSTWADQVKKQRGNGEWHYIDVNTGVDPGADAGNKKGTCTPNLARDCSGTGNAACIVSVISSQGSILGGSCKSAPTVEQAEALKYLVHFFGDVVQPLHACGYKRGGNDVPVKKFDVQEASSYGPLQLHWIWDASILVKTMGGRTTPKGQTVQAEQVDAYIANLVSRIKTGDMKSKAASWARCQNPDRGSSTLCPLEWAADSSNADCTTVFAGYSPTADLGGDYYAKNAPIVDQQLAKGGVRLAAYLDELLACKGASNPTDPTTPTDPSTACPSAEFPDYLFVRTENLCCSKPTKSSKKRYSYLCEEADGTVVRKYSQGKPFPPAQPLDDN